MLSIDVASDPELNRLSPDAERLYLRALPHLDRDGLITGVPALLWATVAPLRIELMDKTLALVNEWVQQGIVIRYEGPDGPILFFKGFRRHQANLPYGKETPSRFPPPPGWHRCRDGLIPDDAELCQRLAERFDPRSSYRKALLEASQQGRDEVATSSRVGRDEDQDQVKDQDQVHQIDDDDAGGPADLEIIRSWCRAQAETLMPDWMGSAERIARLDARQLTALATWLYAYERLTKGRSGYAAYRPDEEMRNLFEGVSNPVGRVIKQAIEQGNAYPLPPVAHERMRQAIARYADPALILFGEGEDGSRSGRARRAE